MDCFRISPCYKKLPLNYHSQHLCIGYNLKGILSTPWLTHLLEVCPNCHVSILSCQISDRNFHKHVRMYNFFLFHLY